MCRLHSRAASPRGEGAEDSGGHRGVSEENAVFGEGTFRLCDVSPGYGGAQDFGHDGVKQGTHARA